MDPKVMSTVAMLIGILIIFHLFTNSDKSTVVMSESPMEDSEMEMPPMEESEMEMPPMEEVEMPPMEEVEMPPMEEVSVEEEVVNNMEMEPMVEESNNDEPEISSQESAELTFKSKEYTVTGYAGEDYSTF